MGRRARRKSDSGYYHVLLRGVNKQNLFYDDKDREKMKECLIRYQEETGVGIVAYCLMSNHIHLLLHAKEQLDLFIKKLASSYVYYFNKKYDRVGHLFQDRFKSEPIDDEQYLLTVFRYILQNPWKAGICRPEKYAWSSWSSLRGEETDCDISVLLDIGGGLTKLKKFVLADNDDNLMDIEESKSKLSEAQAVSTAFKITGEKNLQVVASYEKERREDILIKMKRAGISVRQISRLTGLNRNVIQRAGESRNLSP